MKVLHWSMNKYIYCVEIIFLVCLAIVLGPWCEGLPYLSILEVLSLPGGQAVTVVGRVIADTQQLVANSSFESTRTRIATQEVVCC